MKKINVALLVSSQSEKISCVNRGNTLLMHDNGLPIRWERILHNLLKRFNSALMFLHGLRHLLSRTSNNFNCMIKTMS